MPITDNQAQYASAPPLDDTASVVVEHAGAPAAASIPWSIAWAAHQSEEDVKVRAQTRKQRGKPQAALFMKFCEEMVLVQKEIAPESALALPYNRIRGWVLQTLNLAHQRRLTDIDMTCLGPDLFVSGPLIFVVVLIDVEEGRPEEDIPVRALFCPVPADLMRVVKQLEIAVPNPPLKEHSARELLGVLPPYHTVWPTRYDGVAQARLKSSSLVRGFYCKFYLDKLLVEELAEGAALELPASCILGWTVEKIASPNIRPTDIDMTCLGDVGFRSSKGLVFVVAVLKIGTEEARGFFCPSQSDRTLFLAHLQALVPTPLSDPEVRSKLGFSPVNAPPQQQQQKASKGHAAAPADDSAATILRKLQEQLQQQQSIIESQQRTIEKLTSLLPKSE